MHALTCGIPPSSVVEVFSTVMNNSGFKSINSISAWISGYRYISRFDAKISVIGKSQNSHIGAILLKQVYQEFMHKLDQNLITTTYVLYGLLLCCSYHLQKSCGCIS